MTGEFVSAKWLDKLNRDRGEKTLQQVADAIGVKLSTMVNWFEMGRVPLARFIDLAECLGYEVRLEKKGDR